MDTVFLGKEVWGKKAIKHDINGLNLSASSLGSSEPGETAAAIEPRTLSHIKCTKDLMKFRQALALLTLLVYTRLMGIII